MELPKSITTRTPRDASSYSQKLNKNQIIELNEVLNRSKIPNVLEQDEMKGNLGYVNYHYEEIYDISFQCFTNLLLNSSFPFFEKATYCYDADVEDQYDFIDFSRVNDIEIIEGQFSEKDIEEIKDCVFNDYNLELLLAYNELTFKHGYFFFRSTGVSPFDMFNSDFNHIKVNATLLCKMFYCPKPYIHPLIHELK